MNIINSSVYMKSEPTETSPLETECLFGESVEILENFAGWVYCKLLTDNYFGWIKKNSLGKLTNTTHRIINKNSFVYKEPSEKSNILLYLPLGSRLVVEKIKFGWALLVISVIKVNLINYLILIRPYISSNLIISSSPR